MAAFRETSDAQEALKTFFGFDALRPGQDAAVEAIIAGKDTLAIMPTGGGKSLCYQLPALCRPGMAIVVSPLIALMKDQVDALQAKGIPAAAINSSLGTEEYRQAMTAFRHGELKIVYVAPERFAQEGFMHALKNARIALLAVDEAHCLSQWGHDFRPDYLRLGKARQELGFPQTVALTATATEHVRQDILNTLQLQNPAIIISGFGRDNLDFSITHCEGRKAKFEQIRKIIAQWKKGVIYCSTRKNVMAVFEEVRVYSQAVAYHAGMTDAERTFSQDAFTSGRADVVVATNAFGMGIDRPDVRFVIHFEIPGSIEAYYQEAGRAGRDGETSVCALLFNHADIKTQEFFFEGSNPPLHLVRMLYNLLSSRCDPSTKELKMTVDAMAAELGRDTNPMAVSSSLSILLHAGAIVRLDVPGENVKCTRVPNPGLPFEAYDIDRASLEEKARRDHLKIEAITRYAYSAGCRQQWILNYFGETDSEPCGHCDACCAGEPEEAAEITGEDLVIVRKALAGVARASRRAPDGSWQAVYGRSKIMDMLRGAKNAHMHRYLTSLSTYGILSSMTDAKLKALFRSMQEGGLLQTTGGEKPLVTLTSKGEAVMKEQSPTKLTRRIWSEKETLRQSSAALLQRSRRALDNMALGRMDKTLYEHLSELRRDLASEYRMPVFRILSTEAMRAMATIKPTTMEAASRLKGVGPWIQNHTLRAFIELIQDYEES